MNRSFPARVLFFFLALLFGASGLPLIFLVGETIFFSPEEPVSGWSCVLMLGVGTLTSLFSLGFMGLAFERDPVRSPGKIRDNTPAGVVCRFLYEDNDGPRKASDAFNAFAASRNMTHEKKKRALIRDLPLILGPAFQDKVFSEEEEAAFTAFLELQGIGLKDIPVRLLTRVVRAALIRDLLNGVVRPRQEEKGLPFNFLQSETLVWSFRFVIAFEITKTIEYLDRTEEHVLRTAKGIYWKKSSARPVPVRRKLREKLGAGTLAITSDHIYFAAGSTSFRIPHNHIIRLQPAGQSVMISEEGDREKTIEFIVDDPVFVANVMSNARNWQNGGAAS